MGRELVDDWVEALQHESNSYWAGMITSDDEGSDTDDDMPDLELPVAPAA